MLLHLSSAWQIRLGGAMEYLHPSGYATVPIKFSELICKNIYLNQILTLFNVLPILISIQILINPMFVFLSKLSPGLSNYVPYSTVSKKLNIFLSTVFAA
jgi:hypothetical protein